MSVLAWHLTSGYRLRDGRPLPDIGVRLTHDGPLRPCQAGLHASEDILDALAYAPGYMLHRVELSGKMLPHGAPQDKWCARERTIRWSFDAEAPLIAFARWCALRVVHLWDAPLVVIHYLRTGDLEARDAAWATARATARAWAVASDAARAAAEAVASGAVSGAASGAASAAARARAAAEAVASGAVSGAASGAARAAARARAAAEVVASGAVSDAQRAQLLAMVEEARGGRTEWIWNEEAGL